MPQSPSYWFVTLETDTDGVLYAKYPDPKLAAYRYMTRLQRQGRTPQTEFADNVVTVKSDGLATLRFYPE